MCKVFVPKVCYYRKRIAKLLLQRSNMSIEKGLSTGRTPAECYVHKRTGKDSDKRGDNNFTSPRRQFGDSQDHDCSTFIPDCAVFLQSP